MTLYEYGNIKREQILVSMIPEYSLLPHFVQAAAPTGENVLGSQGSQLEKKGKGIIRTEHAAL